MSIDTISNFLTSVRNAIARAKSSVTVPYSRFTFSLALILKQEGFVKDVVIKDAEPQKEIVLYLKYVDNESAIHEIKQISKPGRRVYVPCNCIPTVIGGLGIAIMTTNKGLLTNKAARESGVGGEIVCTIW